MALDGRRSWMKANRSLTADGPSFGPVCGRWTTVRRQRAKVRSHSRTACAPALACPMCAHSDGCVRFSYGLQPTAATAPSAATAAVAGQALMASKGVQPLELYSPPSHPVCCRSWSTDEIALAGYCTRACWHHQWPHCVGRHGQASV